MIIKVFKIAPETAIKISDKHNVSSGEIYDVLKNDKPKFRKVGGSQYVAIGLSKSRHITIFFTYEENIKEAEITTAYPSGKGQIKSYKRM